MQESPLAYRLRPQKLEDYVGQKHLLGANGAISLMLKNNNLFSFILFGPPGSGKTTLAHLLSKNFQAIWQEQSALTIGVADIRSIAKEAKNPFLHQGQTTVLFLDEIHRLNKAQQDALLPFVEDGTFVLIGATTENPYFSINKALLSRCSVFMTQPIEPDDVAQVLKKGLAFLNEQHNFSVNAMEDEALLLLSKNCSGDLRFALNVLEKSYIKAATLQSKKITLENIKDNFAQAVLNFDQNGEEHYDNISALIKSMRGSDPQASIYYLARALAGGERPEYLARRILICASEDVGLANPSILTFCQSILSAVKEIGMPEARILLAEAVLLVATSPKSNSAYLAINEALEYVKNNPNPPIPYHLRNAPLKGLSELGYGVDYKYPHNYEQARVGQNYFPSGLEELVFWQAKDLGYEGKLNYPLNNSAEHKSKN